MTDDPRPDFAKLARELREAWEAQWPGIMWPYDKVHCQIDLEHRISRVVQEREAQVRERCIKWVEYYFTDSRDRAACLRRIGGPP